MYKSKLKHSGFTIIEILVALAIGAILIGGISQVYVTLKQTNKISFALSRIQESSRLANDLLLEEISHIGFIGCVDPMLGTINVQYDGAPSWIENFESNVVSGWDVTATGWGDSVGLDNIDGAGAENALLNSDVIRAQFLSRSSLSLSADMANQSANIPVTNNLFGLETGDVAAIVGDCTTIEVFKVTGTTETPVTLAHTSSLNSSDNFDKAYESDHSSVRLLLSNTYFVGDTGRTNSTGDPVRALFRYDFDGRVEEIIEGVENMQIQYGQEISMPGAACDRSQNQFRFVNASDGSLDMSSVSVVKIGLLMASAERVLNEDDTTVFQLQDQSIGNTGTTITYDNDRRLRKAVNMTFKVRNRRTTACEESLQ